MDILVALLPYLVPLSVGFCVLILCWLIPKPLSWLAHRKLEAGHRSLREPHVDHIYPISLGRHSTKDNMPIVCEGGKSKKGDMTLGEFAETYNLDGDFIEFNLEKLKKKF